MCHITTSMLLIWAGPDGGRHLCYIFDLECVVLIQPKLSKALHTHH